MNPYPMEFRTGVIAPVECLKEGWATIKDRYWLFLGLTVVAMLVSSVVPIVLVGPMMCGLYLCLFAKRRNEPVEFGLLFKGFDYFVPGLIAAAIQVVPAVIIMIIGEVFFAGFIYIVVPQDRGEAPPPLFWVGLVLFVLFAVIVSLVIHTLFLFAYPLIVDRKLSGWDAIKTSARASLKNIGGVLGLILLMVGLGILGVIACYVGVFLVMPISFAAYAAAYRRVFPDIGPPGFPSPPPPPGNWAA
jgi:uncharacterized membrane protein